MLSNLVFHAQSTRTVQKTRAIKVEETDLTVTCCHRARELCDSGGGRRGLPVPNKPYGRCGRKATLNLNSLSQGSGAA